MDIEEKIMTLNVRLFELCKLHNEIAEYLEISCDKENKHYLKLFELIKETIKKIK